MRKILAKSVRENLKQAASALFVLASLSLLISCQGVSTGGSGSGGGSQSTLGLGSGSLTFGNVVAGSSKTLTVTATNPGPASITVTSAAVSTKYFSLTGTSLPVTVAAGQSTPIKVMFSPNAVGAFNGTVTVTSDATNGSASVGLSGDGVTPGQLALNPASESFGTVTTGTQQSQTVTLTNTGGLTVNISQASVTGTGFQLSGIIAPLALNPSQSTTFSVTFAPQSSGAATGAVNIVSDASNPSLSLALSGTGASPGALGDSPANLSFGNVTVGSNQALTETLTNTGGTSVTISQVGISGTGFTVTGITTPLTLSPSQSANLTVTFAPQSAGTTAGSLNITSTATNSALAIPLSGTGVTPGVLGSSPASLSFGSVIVGNNEPLTETITNTGGTSVTISQAALSGTGFTLSGITTPLTLTPSQSATFTVTFAPQAAGNATGSVTITSNASNPTLTIALAGTGASPGGLGSNPGSLSFGNVTLGNNSQLSETITNTGGSSVTVSQVSVAGTGFTFSGITTPVTLAASQSATFTVTFTPQAAGNATGTVTVTSTASNPTLAIPLTGAGITPATIGANPTSLSFGSVTLGGNSALSETITNTGGSSATISQVSVSGTGFTVSGITTPLTLNPSQSKTFTVTYTPQAAGSATGTVTVASNASNSSLAMPLSGTGVTPGTLGANPTSLGFGSVNVGSNKPLTETITNTGGSSVTISQVAASGTGFSVSGITTPVTLTSGQSTTFTVTFAPASAGSASGTATVTSNASNPSLSIPLSGTGVAIVGQLTISPSTLGIGSVVVGTSGTGSGSLNATGASVTVTAASTNNSVFTVSGLSLPVTIPAGQSVPFTITFSPTITGAASANLTVTSNASPSTSTESLTGTGTPAPVHTVNLSWTPSSSPNINGYNIYRALYTSSTCGSFAKINTSLDGSTLYTDSNVTDGDAYCYAATAVNTSNEESGYSNIVSNVQIPAP